VLACTNLENLLLARLRARKSKSLSARGAETLHRHTGSRIQSNEAISTNLACGSSITRYKRFGLCCCAVCVPRQQNLDTWTTISLALK